MANCRRAFLRSLTLFGIASPLLASGTQAPRPSRVRRIGFINGAEPSLNAAFEDELRRLGYVEGENIAVQIRLLSGAPAELQRHVDEFARMDLELVVVGALPMALAMRQ